MSNVKTQQKDCGTYDRERKQAIDMCSMYSST
jgi:hypothetical protein